MERRHFSRIGFNAPVELHQENRLWEGQVVDISLKGLLVDLPQWEDMHQSKTIGGTIRLAGDAIIEMTLKLVHTNRGLVGFYCENIDVESIRHLRRLVELNLGDSNVLERELAEFADY